MGRQDPQGWWWCLCLAQAWLVSQQFYEDGVWGLHWELEGEQVLREDD